MPLSSPARSTSYAADASSVRGSTTPRLYLPPLATGPPGPCGCGCALTVETTEGFDVVLFATDVLGVRLYPWQRWLLIHALELVDGRYRFGTILLLVARQNGKSTVLSVLAAYWQFSLMVPNILYTSTKLSAAKKWWQKVVRMVERSPDLVALRPPRRWTSNTNGEEKSWTVDSDDTGEPSTLAIAASNAEGGRGDTNDRVVMDELREHHDYTAWDAAEPSTAESAHDPQVWAVSNAGSDRSVVLNDLRAAGVKAIETGDRTSRLFLAEWSAPEDADPMDLVGIAQANPSLGHGPRRVADLLEKAKQAVDKGGEKLSGYKTEYLCIRVARMSPAVDPAAWLRCLDVGNLNDVRPRVVVALDVAPDMQHATVVAAAVLDDGRVRVEPIQSWSGSGCTHQVRRALPRLLATVRPRVLGWLRGGPAEALLADLAAKRGNASWPPRGVTVAEVTSETPAVCMSFADLVSAGQIAHSADPLLDLHVAAAEKRNKGDVWVFSRKGEGNVDAVYAAAAAAFLARVQPVGNRPRLVVARHADTPTG